MTQKVSRGELGHLDLEISLPKTRPIAQTTNYFFGTRNIKISINRHFKKARNYKEVKLDKILFRGMR